MLSRPKLYQFREQHAVGANNRERFHKNMVVKQLLVKCQSPYRRHRQFYDVFF